MNESSFWRWLSSRLPPGDFTRIESPCSPGVPDVNYTLERRYPYLGDPNRAIAVHGWIELKIGAAGRYPFKADRRGLRASQRLWLHERLPLGTIIAIVALIGPNVAAWRLRDDQVDGFNELSRDELHEIADFWTLRRTMTVLPEFLLK
jgi:hypothetical protein